MRQARLLTFALVVSLAAVACGTTPAVSEAPSTSAAVATAAPTIVPTPIPTAPPDVAALFAAQADSLKSGVLTVEGTATVGSVQLTMSGTSRYSGIDNDSRLITTVAGVATEVASVEVAGKRYEKKGDGPWLETAVSTGPGLASSLRTIAKGALTDTGTVQRNGQTVHKLVPNSSAAFDPASLLGSTAGATNMAAKPTLYAAEDGAPAGASIEATWTQASGETTVQVSMSIDIKFSSLGSAQTIRVPDHVWIPFTSTRYGSSLAYPDDFEYEKDKDYDWFWAPTFGGMSLARAASGGYSLTAWGKSMLDLWKKELRNDTSSNESYTLAGVKARLLTISGKDDNDDKVVVYSLVAIKGKYAYVIEWYGLAGNEAADLATFKQVLSTFAFS